MEVGPTEIPTRTRLALLVVSEGRTFSVDLPDGETLTVGRGKEAEIRLKDERVAITHVTVRAQGENAEVTVVDGSGGAQLNEIQFSRAARMRVGDQLNVGHSALILQRFSLPPAVPDAPVRTRRELAARLEEEAARARRHHRGFLYAIARVRSAKGWTSESLATWRAALEPGALLGELGSEALQVLLLDGSDGSKEHLSRPVRGERPQVGHATFPEDGTDAETLVEVALARLVADSSDGAPADALGALHHAGEEPLFLDPVMVRLLSVLDPLAPLQKPLLVSGERGVGKELVAALIHQRSGREGPLVKVDAAGYPSHELEAELFGAEDSKRRVAAVDRAAKGTLLITHAQALTAPLQTKLAQWFEKNAARAPRLVVTWQEQGTGTTPLERFIDSSLYIPALRDRRDEVLPLADHFLSRCRKRHGRPRLVLGADAKTLLAQAQWPGNLRQLRNAIESAVLVSESDEIRPDDLPPELQDSARPLTPKKDFRTSLKALEKDVLLKALAKTRWNVSKAAAELGLPRRTVVYRMARLGLRRPDR